MADRRVLRKVGVMNMPQYCVWSAMSLRMRTADAEIEIVGVPVVGERRIARRAQCFILVVGEERRQTLASWARQYGSRRNWPFPGR